nr:AI-2E family transporter [uncultured Sphingomonas sp.]
MPQIITKNDKPGMFLVGLFTILFLMVMWPYTMALFWAVVLTVLLDPVWNWVVKHVKLPRSALSLLMVLLIALVLVIPAILLALALPGQINALIEAWPHYQAVFSQLTRDGLNLLPPRLAEELRSSTSDGSLITFSSVAQRLVGIFSSAAQSTLSVFVQLSIMLYVLFYFFYDGRGIYQRTISYLPFSAHLTSRLSERFVAITKATVGGVFVIAVAQGAIAAICYWLLGVQPAIALGAATSVAALIPAIGSGLIWIPVAIYLVLTGSLVKGLIMLAAGFFVISMVDNLLRPTLVGRGTKIPDFVVLVTTLGGLSLMGAAGIVLGPMIAGMCMALWQMTKSDTGSDVAVADTASVPATKTAAPRRRSKPKA